MIWKFLGATRGSDNLWRIVEGAGIVVFVGPNGSGKSLAAVHACLRTLDGIDWSCTNLAHHHADPLRRHVAGCIDGCERDPRKVQTRCVDGEWLGSQPGVTSGRRLVYSTVPLLGPDGDVDPLYRPLVDFRQLVTVEHSDVLFDEVAGISDASDSASVPVQVTNWLHQLRKRDVRLRVTTPAYSRCSKPIRQVAQVVVDARSFWPEPATEGRLWRSRRGMLFRAFDAFAFDNYSAHTSERLQPLARAAYWRPTGEAQHRYDTLSATTALGHVTDAGMCAVCGGGRSRPRCACDHAVDDLPMDQLVVEETVTAAGARTRRAIVRGPLDVPRRLGQSGHRAAGPDGVIDMEAGPDLGSPTPQRSQPG